MSDDKLHIDFGKLNFTPSDKKIGEGVTDECINCHEEIVSTGIMKTYDEMESFIGGPNTRVTVSYYRWTHAATKVSKCATGDLYAAGTKNPPQ